MSSPHTAISIIIVNKNDPGISLTLSSLEELGIVSRAEVVVIDASRGELALVARSFSWAKWIEYAQPEGKSRTIAEQRNLGLDTASGDVLVFLDSGCVPTSTWFDELTSALVSEREDIVVGSVQSSFGSTLHDVGAPHGLDNDGYVSEFSTMNVAVARRVFDQIGQFDEGLGVAEDVDLAWRAHDAGFRSRFAPGAAITHDWGTRRDERRRAFRYGVGRARLIRKHRSRWRNLFSVDIACTAYSLFLVGLPVALFFPWYLALLVVPLAKNRTNHPVATVTYNLVYAAGALSEVFGLPVAR